MAFGSRGQKNFGLQSNMTLPMVSIDPDPNATPQTIYMPAGEEKAEKRKKKARFALDQTEFAPTPEIRRKPTWGQRFKGMFRRSSKKDKGAPDPTPPPSTKSSGPPSSPPPPPPPAEDEEDEEGDDKLLEIIESGLPDDSPPLRRAESDSDLSASRKEKEGEGEGEEEGDKKKRKTKKKSSNRKAKAKSTAFEHITPSPAKGKTDGSFLHLVLKPRSSSSGSRKVTLEHHEDSEDGEFGLHLSGGLPPVTVTYVKPGGQAEHAGVEVGDIILDVNGLNCKKKVDISRLMELKMLIQQRSLKEDNTEHIDAPTWDKIQAKQNDLESEASEVKITSLDSETDNEPASPPPASPPVAAEVKIRDKKNGKKRLSATRASGGEFGGPLAASSPVKDGAVEAETPKKKKNSRSSVVEGDVSASGTIDKKKKKNSRSSVAEDDVNSSTMEKKKKRSSHSEEGGKEEGKETMEKKKKKASRSPVIEESTDDGTTKKKKRSSRSSFAADDDTRNGTSEAGKKKKKADSKRHSTEVKVQAGINDFSIKDPPQIDRSDRHRRSSSPKSRYRLGDAEEAAGEIQAQPEKPTTNGSKKKRKKSKSEDDKKESKKKEDKKSDRESKKKKRKSKDETGEKKATKDKESKKKKRKSSKGETAQETAQPEPSTDTSTQQQQSSTENDLTFQSVAISGSIESNTLTFHASKTSKTSLHSLTETSGTSSRTSTLPRTHRRKSTDSGNSCAFREELREASRSQHDIQSPDKPVTIDIDPNIKVKKSGLIKEGKGSARPSIFDQSSSPEPEPVTSISSGPVEDNILDPEFKVKKSGVMVGRKTSSTTRPSILNEQDKASPSDIQPGEMKYNRKVSEDVDMDISAIPQISPTLGLGPGRDRLSATNRSLTKRRPASLRKSLLLDSKEDEKMGTQRVELSPKTTKSSLPGLGAGGGSRTAAARKLFESKQPENAELAKLNSRFTKSVEKPIKTVGTEGAKKPAKAGEEKTTDAPKPWQQPKSAASGGTPSWIAIAQTRQKRASSILDEKQPTKVITVGATVEQTSADSGSGGAKKGIPEMGHVAKRLAMFQNS